VALPAYPNAAFCNSSKKKDSLQSFADDAEREPRGRTTGFPKAIPKHGMIIDEKSGSHHQSGRTSAGDVPAKRQGRCFQSKARHALSPGPSESEKRQNSSEPFRV
jgi:hypothetical protein